MEVKMICAMYNNADEASAVMKRIRSAKIPSVDRIIISKDRFGKVHINDFDDPTAKEGRRLGVVVGALVGAVGGPIGAALGAFVGGATGNIAANVIQSGLTESELQKLGERLKKRTSTVILLLQEEHVDDAMPHLEAIKSEIVTYDIEVNMTPDGKIITKKDKKNKQ